MMCKARGLGAWISRERREENERLCLSFVLGKWERERRKMARKERCSIENPGHQHLA